MPQQQNLRGQLNSSRVAYQKAPEGLSQSVIVDPREVIKPKASGKRTPVTKVKTAN